MSVIVCKLLKYTQCSSSYEALLLISLYHHFLHSFSAPHNNKWLNSQLKIFRKISSSSTFVYIPAVTIFITFVVRHPPVTQRLALLLTIKYNFHLEWKRYIRIRSPCVLCLLFTWRSVYRLHDATSWKLTDALAFILLHQNTKVYILNRLEIQSLLTKHKQSVHLKPWFLWGTCCRVALLSFSWNILSRSITTTNSISDTRAQTKCLQAQCNNVQFAHFVLNCSFTIKYQTPAYNFNRNGNIYYLLFTDSWQQKTRELGK